MGAKGSALTLGSAPTPSGTGAFEVEDWKEVVVRHLEVLKKVTSNS